MFRKLVKDTSVKQEQLQDFWPVCEQLKLIFLIKSFNDLLLFLHFPASEDILYQKNSLQHTHFDTNQGCTMYNVHILRKHILDNISNLLINY